MRSTKTLNPTGRGRSTFRCAELRCLRRCNLDKPTHLRRRGSRATRRLPHHRRDLVGPGRPRATPLPLGHRAARRVNVLDVRASVSGRRWSRRSGAERALDGNTTTSSPPVRLEGPAGALGHRYTKASEKRLRGAHARPSSPAINFLEAADPLAYDRSSVKGIPRVRVAVTSPVIRAKRRLRHAAHLPIYKALRQRPSYVRRNAGR
jgi:hypothetical protein